MLSLFRFMFRKHIFALIAVLLLSGVVLAQDIVSDACAELVLKALQMVEAVCADLDGNHVCYASEPVEFESIPTFVPQLQKAGDRAPLPTLISLHSSPVNVKDNEWGIAVLSFQADEAATTGSTRILVLGDVTISDVANDAGLSFNLATNEEEPSCAGAANSVIIRTPDDAGSDLTINGSDLHLEAGTTVVADSIPDKRMRFLVVTGSLSVTAQSETQDVAVGKKTVVKLGGTTGLEIQSAPSEADDYDTALLQFLPFHLLSQVIEIPSEERWTDTGIELEAGQSFIVIGSELVKTYEDLPWSSPDGHSPADCSAAGRTDWDCKCRTLPEWGTCTIDELASMKMVGKIGDETPFEVGTGGIFVAESDGVLSLGTN
ncbi:MAG TPA: hypothetical protein VHL11_03405, partial [Phototrophicaceae bacterium]|nr:hypothetical protein [Phototrophicaceae bacterium]